MRTHGRWPAVAVVVVIAGALAAINGCGHKAGKKPGMDAFGPGADGYVADGASCPAYQINCHNMCVTTSDPMNCGGCGITCPANQVCSAGGCAGSCLTGLNACSGTCVDLQSDDNNCGTCGHACGSNSGCVGGQCVPATVYPTPAMCAGGGPPPAVGSGSSTQTCAGGLGATTFTWSVCSCTNALMTDNALLDGWNSTHGPYMPGQLGGGLGADNTITSDSVLTIWGAMWAGSNTGTPINTQAATIYDNVECGASVSGGTMAMKHDAYVVGDISGCTLDAAGKLYQPSGRSHAGIPNSQVVNQPVTVNPPCDCTSPVPVAGIVAWGKTHNDNAMISLDPNALTGTHPARIDLPCGEYYLSGINAAGTTSVVVHGKTVVFVDSSITANDLTFTVADSNSQLDLFVNGTITSGGTIRFGNPNYPALTRIYLATTNQFELSSSILISGNIWVGNGKLLWTSNSDMFGAIFAHDFEIQSAFNLHYDQGVVGQGSQCGTPPTGCMTCKDCNNQACNSGTCGACQTSADCCAPLTCQNGTCAPFIP